MNFFDFRPARPAQQSAVAAAMLALRTTAPTPRSIDGFGWEIWTLASPSKLWTVYNCGSQPRDAIKMMLIFPFIFDNYRFQLLKLMQKCGAIEKFDMLFHKGGPMVGQSRGYAFVTFAHNEGATNALMKLDGTNVGSRSIAVRLAKNIKYVSKLSAIPAD